MLLHQTLENAARDHGSMLGWILRVVVAVAGGLTIYVIGASMLRKFKLAPPPDPDTDEIQPVNLRFRCAV